MILQAQMLYAMKNKPAILFLQEGASPPPAPRSHSAGIIVCLPWTAA